MFRKSMIVVFMLVLKICFAFDQSSSQESILKWGVHQSVFSASPKERFVFCLLQENIRSKVEKFFVNAEIPYRIVLEKNTLPSQFSVFFDEKEVDKVTEFNQLLAEKDPCFLEDNEAIKEVWQDWIQKEKSQYTASEEKVEFLKSSEKILQEFSRKDLVALFQHSSSHLLARNYAYKEPFMSSKQAIGKREFSLTEDEKIFIRRAISGFANKTIKELMVDLKNVKEEKGLEVSLDNEKSLRYISFILIDPESRQSLKTVSQDEKKWKLFALELMRRVRKQRELGVLNQNISEFANFLGVDRNVIQEYVDQERYKELLVYLQQIL